VLGAYLDGLLAAIGRYLESQLDQKKQNASQLAVVLVAMALKIVNRNDPVTN